jgi:hypothetical protein
MILLPGSVGEMSVRACALRHARTDTLDRRRLLDVIAIKKAPEGLFDQKNVKHAGR